MWSRCICASSTRPEWVSSTTIVCSAISAIRPRFPPTSAIVRIPRFGLKYAKPVLEGTDRLTLQKGIGHYPETVMPGEIGYRVIDADGNPLEGATMDEPAPELQGEWYEKMWTSVKLADTPAEEE